MHLYHALIIAFSTYSKIPMPQIDWTEENMRYSMCFFPLIGLVIGGLYVLWVHISALLGFSTFFRGIIASLIPLLASGGIHMDGFMDTFDALSSHQSKERKLEILKDPHAGAFAVLGCTAYMLIYAGTLSEVGDMRVAGVIALGFCASRALSALALVRFRKARPSGLLTSFAQAARERAVTTVMMCVLVACGAGMLAIHPWAGACAIFACALSMIYYRVMAYRQFGGVTGDLAGHFLQICELTLALAAMCAGRIGG